jgi:hypothetical protein
LGPATAVAVAMETAMEAMEKAEKAEKAEHLV